MKNNDPRALNTVKSWMAACRISFRTGRWPEADLVVTNAAGQEVGVSVVIKGSPVAEGSLVVNGSDITHRALKVALEAFASLQQALGFEPKLPVDRGAIPERRPYGDDFDLVVWRHTEFRRSPNPDRQKLEKYKSTAEKASWKFYRSNQRLCADHMLQVEDLIFGYALVWTTNYIALYEIPAERALQNDNERLLYTYLTQRFAEFRTSLNRKGRNELPVLDAAFIGLRGRPYDYSNKTSWLTERDEAVQQTRPMLDVDDTDDEDEDYVARHRELDVSSPNARRASATQLLETQLASLPHDEMVSLLTAASENGRIHVDARKEAGRRLRAHVQSCCACTGTVVQVEDEEDEAPGSEEAVS
jgi:hypothetical protein